VLATLKGVPSGARCEPLALETLSRLLPLCEEECQKRATTPVLPEEVPPTPEELREHWVRLERLEREKWKVLSAK